MMDLLHLLKQTKHLQTKLVEIQKQLTTKRVEVATGGGLVTVVADGEQNIVSLKIDPQIFDRENKEMVESLVVAAVNEAKRKSQEIAADEIKKMAGGLNFQSLLSPILNMVEKT